MLINAKLEKKNKMRLVECLIGAVKRKNDGYLTNRIGNFICKEKIYTSVNAVVKSSLHLL